jgi:hypothetical protein
MTLTPGLTLLGLLLVLLAIPLAFSLAPLAIGIIVLAFAVRRANEGFARPACVRPADQSSRGPAERMASLTPSA